MWIERDYKRFTVFPQNHSWKEEKKHEVRTIYNQFLKENNGNNEEILGPIAADFHLFADPQLMMSAEFWWEIQF